MKNLLIVVMVFGLAIQVQAQDSIAAQVSGVVSDAVDRQPIPGVNIYWQGTTQGVVSDADGSYSIDVSVPLPAALVFSYVGFQTEIFNIIRPAADFNIAFKSSLEIGTVDISERRETFTFSSASTIHTEAINRGVLRKAACCNLSESFETTASVDVVLNDAVTGARKIQMLGLEGVYVQNLFEGIPFSRGLGNVLGFDQIPGPWINEIQLTKGVGSAINGYESMTGQINLEFLPSDGEEVLHADIFASNQARYEANAIWNKNLSERWSTALFAGVHTQQMKVDQNDDGFLDMPLREGVKLMNRWKYSGDRLRSHIVAKYTSEERTAGQTGFNRSEDLGTTDAYGFGMDYQQAEVLAKLGILSLAREDRSVGITGIYSYTDVDTYFGMRRYAGIQHNARLNAIFQTKFAQYSDHGIAAGVHYLYDDYNEALDDSVFTRTEQVPGIFAEYTYERPRFTAVAGARTDFHNLYGTQFSPRLHLKYNLKPLTTLRTTAGRGFRSANVYADQLGLLASSRQIRVLENPGAESSWNTGVSFMHKFELGKRDAVFNMDYYYTAFENQLVVDRDFDAGQLLFYNLQGQSFAHSFQTDFQAELVKGLGAKVSYKYQDVQMDYISGRLDKPMIPRHRALFNVGYTSPNGNWYLDFTTNWYGTSRLPNTAGNPEEFRIAERSDSFFILNSQVTRVIHNFEIYVGAENLGNFIQSNAIIDAENPFGSNFDASMIYGPLNGRTFYIGARLKLKTKKS